MNKDGHVFNLSYTITKFAIGFIDKDTNELYLLNQSTNYQEKSFYKFTKMEDTTLERLDLTYVHRDKDVTEQMIIRMKDEANQQLVNKKNYLSNNSTKEEISLQKEKFKCNVYLLKEQIDMILDNELIIIDLTINYTI